MPTEPVPTVAWSKWNWPTCAYLRHICILIDYISIIKCRNIPRTLQLRTLETFSSVKEVHMFFNKFIDEVYVRIV
jgi:hypothetical protein